MNVHGVKPSHQPLSLRARQRSSLRHDYERCASRVHQQRAQTAEPLRQLQQNRAELANSHDRLVLEQYRHQRLRPVLDERGHLEEPERVAARRGVHDDEAGCAGVDGVGHVDDGDKLIDPWRREINQPVHHLAIVARIESHAAGGAVTSKTVKERVDGCRIPVANGSKRARGIDFSHLEIRRSSGDGGGWIGDRRAEYVSERVGRIRREQQDGASGSGRCQRECCGCRACRFPDAALSSKENQPRVAAGDERKNVRLECDRRRCAPGRLA
jgi:hypothetical protein